MSAMPWILITVGVFLILFAILFVYLIKRRKKPRPPNYYAFFVLGLVWLPIGIAMGNYVLAAMGFIFMVIGLVNKKKWKKNMVKWKDMEPFERKFTIIILVGLLVLVILGLLAFFLIV
jgi:hypothetical protein